MKHLRALSRLLLAVTVVALAVALVGFAVWVAGSGGGAGSPDEVSGLTRTRTLSGSALVVAVIAGTAWAWLRGIRRSRARRPGR